MTSISPVSGSDSDLGESPLWSVAQQALFWVDVTAPALCRLQPATGGFRRWAFDRPLAAVALTNDRRLLLVFRSKIALFDCSTSVLEELPVQAIDPEERFNDGRCDRRGRFWVGTFDRKMRNAIGRLYCLSGASLRCVDQGFDLSNGIAWSPDDTTLYFTDTAARRIYAYAYDADSGELANRRIHAEFVGTGRPDGCVIDSSGDLWVALAGGGAVVRLDPTGRERTRIELPTSRPSSCAFGGRGLDELYVTSMRHGLDAHQLARETHAGRVFLIEGTGCVGLPEPVYRVNPDRP